MRACNPLGEICRYAVHLVAQPSAAKAANHPRILEIQLQHRTLSRAGMTGTPWPSGESEEDIMWRLSPRAAKSRTTRRRRHIIAPDTYEWILFQHLLYQDCEAVEALSHVGATERQVKSLHRMVLISISAFSSRSVTYRRTASGSLPDGREARRPSASSTRVTRSRVEGKSVGHEGRSRLRTTLAAAPRSSDDPHRCQIGAGLPLPESRVQTRHRKSTLVTIRCARATCRDRCSGPLGLKARSRASPRR